MGVKKAGGGNKDAKKMPPASCSPHFRAKIFFTCPACRNVLFLQKRRKSNRRQKSGMLLGVSDGRVASFLPNHLTIFSSSTQWSQI